MSRWIFWGCMGWVLMGCNEDLSLLAPYQEQYVVYAVLDATADSQAVRVSRVFQSPGNVYTYADTGDFNVKDLQVKLEGAGLIWLAVFRDSLLKTGSGDFGTYGGAYFFHTSGATRLSPGQTYRLTLTRASDSGFLITATTTIPAKPEVISPSLIPEARFGDFCLPTFSIEDSARVVFRRSKAGTLSHAWGFEVRVLVGYDSAQVQRKEQFGPSPIFNQNESCGTGNAEILCYELPKQGIIPVFTGRGWDREGGYRYDKFPVCGPITSLSRAIEVQVTAVDTNLGKMLSLRDPRYPNFNDYRREVSNLQGTVRVLGVFGSVAYQNVPVTLSPCAEYRLGLNGSTNPNACPR